MKHCLKTDPWMLVEEGFDPARVKASESLFSIGNGVMGGRGNFEEHYSGDSMQGNYIGGVYYPDKTRVGWWKNGYPEYFAKVLNSAFWIGAEVTVDDESEAVDLAKCEVVEFRRELDFRCSVLRRRVVLKTPSGVELELESERFVSMRRRETGVVRYAVRPLNRACDLTFAAYIEADVRNEDANYDELFWEEVTTEADGVQCRTKKSGFEVAWFQQVELEGASMENHTEPWRVRQTARVHCRKGEQKTLYKYVGICSSLNHPSEELVGVARQTALEARRDGFEKLLREQTKAWSERWHSGDVVIEGDERAQQGIRFCIFMLLQTYTGVDSRLNIGPKGFTGEKYGGVTYWDTEAYCLMFYLATVGRDVARQLLIYRYNQLDRAIENAAKIGFKGGAALYPMVTINGEECHNEWEITFEEIHRNGAIAYAIYNYVRYTQDRDYLAEYGLEVLLSIARFWAQRITWSEARGQYVMLGVTGPNEYENNVNNNWYTSYIACWSMRYAAEVARWVRENHPADFERIVKKRNFDCDKECARWEEINRKMYFGKDEKLGIFLQQDGYLDKEQILAKDLDPAERPVNQHWSWDRILRSCFIKQADVLQGLYFFEDDFDLETIRRNYLFYEPRTLHESSLSPCVHGILATRLGMEEKAYEMYLRTARLDLDDYNHEAEEGCHVTSMAGSWLSVVEGFGGMRMHDGVLSFTPKLPTQWTRLAFKVNYRGRVLSVDITHRGVEVHREGDPVELEINQRRQTI